MEERKHAVLGASKAHRWMKCPPSARLEEKYEEEESKYADEGNLAHELAALELKKTYYNITDEEYNKELDLIKSNPLWKEEMIEYVKIYTDLGKELYEEEKANNEKAEIYIEEKVRFDHVAPEGFGTCDCGIVSNSRYIIVDLKYGKGVFVKADKNPQLILYALGFIKDKEETWGKNPVATYICQPRMRSQKITKYESANSNIKSWGTRIKKVAQVAFKGEGHLKGGEWCRFCKHRKNCYYSWY